MLQYFYVTFLKTHYIHYTHYKRYAIRLSAISNPLQTHYTSAKPITPSSYKLRDHLKRKEVTQRGRQVTRQYTATNYL